ncbi:MAG: hypothetical protein GY926_18565 [bacterium]|nr:hypothetical protein [bacterium]
MMFDDRDEALQLLRSVDILGGSITPDEFDRVGAAARFAQLAKKLETDFGCKSKWTPDTQEMALHNLFGIAGDVVDAQDDVWIMVSNYSPLAMYHVGRVNPGAAADVRDQLRPETRSKIEGALTDCGYTVVPNAVLWEPYDGLQEGLRRAKFSWFTRFFDYH